MRRYLLVIFTLIFAQAVQSQTFTGTGGAIPDAGVQTFFPISVSGVGILDANYGLASVCISINHPFDSDLEILLKAPDGNKVELSIQNGANGSNYTNTCFTATAMMPIASGTAPFSGSFLPQGYLGNVNNGQNGDGVWNLCVQDKNARDVGSLVSWSLTFNLAPAPPPPGCTGNLPAGNTCAEATPVCNFNGFCGNTSLSYSADTWPELSAAFCGVIENNSFLSFVASSSVVSFNVWVTNSLNADGIEMMIFSGGCGAGPVQKYACNTGIIPSATGPTLLTASGLTPGNVYYIMIDGKNADVCDYTLVAASGINTLSVAQSKPAVCQGQNMILTANGGNGNYSWSPAEGLNTVTGATVSANPDTTTIYTVTSTPLGNCVLTTEITVKVNPKPDLGADQLISICASGSVDLDKRFLTAGLTSKWTKNGTPVANPASVSSPGVYRLIVTSKAGCSDTAFATILINLKPSIGADKQVNICQGDSTDISNQFTTFGFASSWSFGGLPVPDSTKVHVPGIYEVIVSDGSVNSACADTALLTVTEIPRPALGPDLVKATCSGQVVNLAGQFNTAGLTEIWFYGGVPLGGTIANKRGVYELRATDASGCTDTAFFTVTVKGVPSLGGNKEVHICSGISVNLNSVYDTTGLLMNWEFGGLTVPDLTNVTTAGIYNVVATNAVGCSSSLTVTIIIDSKLNLGPDKILNICPGVKIDLTTQYSTYGISSVWTINSNPVLAPYIVSADGDYQLISDNGGTCIDTAIVKITSRIKPDLGTDKSITICSNSSLDLYIVYDTTSLNTVVWTYQGGMAIANPKAANAPGIYRLIARNIFTCADTAFMTLATDPSPVLGNDTAVNFCPGTTVDLTKLYASSFSAQWFLNGLPVADPAAVNIAGVYQLIATNSFNCSDTAYITVSENSKPALGVNKSITICPGSTLGLTAQYNTSGLHTDWSTGGVIVANPASINTSGAYQLIATNNFGCSDTAVVSVTIKPKPNLGADKKIPRCVINNIDLTSEHNTTGLVTSWTFNNVSIPPPAAVNTDGVYQLIATNSSGCSDTVLLSVILSPKPIIGNDTVVAICSGSPFNLEPLFDTTGTGLATDWTYNSLPVSRPDSIVASGQYMLVVSNAEGCLDTSFTQVNIKPLSSSTTKIIVCSNQLPYIWNGNSYSSTGTYNVVLTSAVNCDSIATLELIVNTTSSSTTPVTICSNQLPYLWNGNSYSSAGTYNVTLINSVNCDSIATLELTVNSTSSSTTPVVICSNGLPYVWNGNTYSSGGTYNMVLTNAVNCDSVATLVLTVNSTSSSITPVTICSNQLPYVWNGNSYSSAGTYNVTLINTVNCDSIATLELTVNSTSSSITPVTICSNQLPYVWNGNSYPSAGMYNVVLTNAANCDSIATLALTVNSTSSSITPVTICSNQLPYVWNGNSYSLTGTYNVAFTNAVNCDSVATLDLTVNSTSSSTTEVTICSNQLPCLWNGNSYSSAGTYNVALVNAAGCDSSAILELTVNSTSSSTTPVTICSNRLPYLWNGNSYSSAGTYNVILINAVNCDSIATLELTVNSTSSSTTPVIICSNQLPYLWNGNSYSAAGVYSVVLTNAANCDSVATLELTANSTSSSTTPVTICSDQLPYLWNGNSYSSAGTYNVVLINGVSCDSVATLVLTVNSTSASTTNVTVCSNYLPYLWNGNSYSFAGTYSVTLINSVNCDSVATLVLKITSTSASTTAVTLCSNQLPYLWNGNSYSSAGSYINIFVNTAGCDSVATLALTVNSTSSSTTNISICESQLPYSWNGNSYSLAGKYSVTLVNAAGCDSTATLDLTVNKTNASTTDVKICGRKFPYVWNNYSYQLPGTYSVTLKNQFGCDSIATLVLSEKPTDTSTTNTSICRAQLPYRWNGNTYSSTGKYTVNLSTLAGCDSVAVLILTVNEATSSITNLSMCTGYLPFYWNGLTLNQAGAYSVVLKNQYGCDSITNLALEVNLSTSSSETKTVCNTQLPFTWKGVEYGFPGTYSDTYINAVGCDSVASFTLIVKQMPFLPSLGEDVVICRGDKFQLAPGNYDNYLWQDLSTASTFNVENSGMYSVAVWEDSNCISRDSINVQVLENCGELFFPNAFTPNGDGRNETFGPGPPEYILIIKNYTLQVFNRYGVIVFSTNNPYQKWDGTYMGKKLDPGTYAWSATYLYKSKYQKGQKGFVVLLR